MNTNDFAMWLHGFFEISESNTLTEKQVQIIKDHLDLCFNKVTPDRSKEEWVQPYFGDKGVGVSLNETYKWDEKEVTEENFMTQKFC